jgi:hypothetical protein
MRRIVLEGALCLLGRFALCHVPLSPAARQVRPCRIAEEAHELPEESKFLHGND